MISIIVPVYNSQTVLERCVESIIRQSFSDWELLLVNDGSTDSSADICDYYASKDSRIRSFHKENGGVSTARNYGLENMQGKWITFIDSDDWVNEYYLERLFSHVGDTVDLVVSYAVVCGNGMERKEVYPSNRINRDNFELMFIENDMNWHTSPWSKLYRAEIVRKNNLRFCEGMHIGEDALFLYTFMMASRNIYISSNTDYYYNAYMKNSLTKRMNSLSSELLSYRNIQDIVCRIIQDYRIQNSKAKFALNWLVGSYVRRVLNSLYHTEVDSETRIRTLKDLDFSAYLRGIVPDTFSQRVLHLLLRMRCWKLYDLIRCFTVKIKESHKLNLISQK